MLSTVQAAPQSLSDYLNARPWTLAQKFVLFLGALAFVADGLANLIIGIATPGILQEWHTTREALAPVAAAGLAGVALGSILGGAIGDRIGRRWGLIGSIAVFSCLTFFAGFSSSIATLEAMRFVGGLGIGAAIPNCAALLTETAPRNKRALIIALAMAFIPVGGMLAGFLGTRLLEPFGWRMLFIVSGAICGAIAVIFVAFLPESPSHLVNRPLRSGELVAVVVRLTGPVAQGVRFCDEPANKQERRLVGLVAPGIRRVSIGIWLGFFCCLLASYTVFSWLPSLMHAHGFSLAASSGVLVAFNGGSMVGGFLVGGVMHRFGSRGPTMVMAIGSALLALGLSVLPLDPQHFVLPSMMLVLLGLLLSGMHNGFYSIAADTYPTVLRARGIGATSAWGRLGAIASSFTGALTAAWGTHAYFIFMGGVLLASFLAVAAARPAALRH